MFRYFFTAFVLLFLTGCQTTPAPRALGAPDYTDSPPFGLAVRSIDVTEDYTFPSKAPHVEHTMDFPPSEMFKIWLKDRMNATGGEAFIQVTIQDASIRKSSLPATPGIRGVFTNDQSEKLDASIVVELRLYKPERAIAVADATARATRSVTVPENASLVERERILFDLSNALVKDVGQELEKQVRRVFASYIVP